MNNLGALLQDCLTGIKVCAWRLHLDTPGVFASVPMLRGVWGSALHQLDPPLYQALFEGSEESPPHYLMRPAPARVEPTPALEFFIFGSTTPSIEERVWLAWELALSRGLGPDRRPARLVAVCPLAWDGTALAESFRQPGFCLFPLPWPTDSPDEPCLLHFPDPLRLMRDGRLITHPTLADLVLAALRRLKGLGGEAGLTAWETRREWLELARHHPAGPWSGRPLDLVRYSGRQRQELEFHGVTGELPLPAGPGPFADLLAAALWLHLGKGTVMGLGQMVVVPVAE